MIDRLRVIEDNLVVVLVIATMVLGLFAPGVGVGLSEWVTPLLALLMLCVSLTFESTRCGRCWRAGGCRLWRRCWCTGR